MQHKLEDAKGPRGEVAIGWWESGSVVAIDCQDVGVVVAYLGVVVKKLGIGTQHTLEFCTTDID